MSAKQKDTTPVQLERKTSWWRFGRRRSSSSTSSSKSRGNSQAAPVSTASPVVMPEVKIQKLLHNQVQLNSASPSKTSETDVGKMIPSQTQLKSASPATTSEVGAHNAAGWNLRKLVHSLSLDDDPQKFGMGTIAARRMQRQELDAAMARTLFSRELIMAGAQSASPAQPVSNGGDQAAVQGDQEWIRFAADPLHYIHERSFSPEAPAVSPSTPTTSTSSPTQELPEQLILPPEAAQILYASLSHTPNSEPEPASSVPKVGLTSDEISQLLITFNQQCTVQRTNTKKRYSRIRKRGAMPKGAKTNGIMSDEETTECSICLIDFEAGQCVGLLPCCHRFHATCAIDWLQRSFTCPECREDLRHHLQ